MSAARCCTLRKCSTVTCAAGVQDADHLPCDPTVVRQHGSERPASSLWKEIKGAVDPGSAARIESMVANRPDWCILPSAHLGVPMSLFVHKETHELHPNTLELMEAAASVLKLMAFRRGGSRCPRYPRS